jgi:hypothetical protein
MTVDGEKIHSACTEEKAGKKMANGLKTREFGTRGGEMLKKICL